MNDKNKMQSQRVAENDDVERQKVIELLRGFDVGMLSTVAADGHLVARPMYIAERLGNGDMVFSTRLDSGKTDEVIQDHRALVTFQSPHKFASIAGTAEMLTSDKDKHHYFRPTMRVWFPDGPSDPTLGFILFHAHTGDYWDMSGRELVRYAFRAARALLTREQLDASKDQGAHGHVEMR